MKSYFSELAKQSGLRYERANTNPPAPAAAKEFGDFTPPHREETILVALPSPRFDAPRKAKSETLPSENSSKKSLQKIEAQPLKNISAEFSKSLENDSLPSAQNAETPVHIIRSTAQIQNEIPEEISKNSLREQTVAVEPADLPVAERIDFTESAITGKKDQPDLSPAQIDFQSEISVRPEVEAIEAAPRQSEYFKKTAESLETGSADKLEIQQILLQEIYEWVNDAPAPNSEQNETEKINVKLPDKNQVVVSAPLEERFEQRSPVEQRNPAKIAAENPKPLEEQNFNLSIGTISIVVEESLPVQNTTIQKTSTEKTTATTTREFSRLNRHYL